VDKKELIKRYTRILKDRPDRAKRDKSFLKLYKGNNDTHEGDRERASSIVKNLNYSHSEMIKLRRMLRARSFQVNNQKELNS